MIMQNNTMITHGLPFAIFAVRIAMYSNMPEFLTTATNIIMPTKTPSVPKSMCSMPVSKLRIPVRIGEHNGARKRGDRTVDLFRDDQREHHNEDH